MTQDSIVETAFTCYIDGIPIDGGLSGQKGQSQIPSKWFFKANCHETFRISKVFGVRGPFSSGIYLLPMAGRDEKLEVWMKKNINLSSFNPLLNPAVVAWR